MAFCKEYNAKTADKAGQIIPVAITVYDVRAPRRLTRLEPLKLRMLSWTQKPRALGVLAHGARPRLGFDSPGAETCLFPPAPFSAGQELLSGAEDAASFVPAEGEG